MPSLATTLLFTLTAARLAKALMSLVIAYSMPTWTAGPQELPSSTSEAMLDFAFLNLV